MLRTLHKALILLLSLGCSGTLLASVSATATITVMGSEQLVGSGWDHGTITLSFNGYSETVTPGQFSTSSSLASAIAAMFTRDYVSKGLYAKAGANANADPNVITFQLTNGQVFGTPTILNSSISFLLSPGTLSWAHLMISWITPSPASIGTTVTITGTLFGSSQGASTVTFNGKAAVVSSWSQHTLVVVVPAGATTGDVFVTVNGLQSNGFLFMIPTQCSQ